MCGHRWCSAGFLAVIALAAAGTAAAAERAGFPSKPIRVIVPVAPGGASDTLARVVGLKLGERLGQTVIVDNRPGGGTIIGTELVARAPADGYTLLLVSVAHASNASLVKKLPYDPISDFAGVSILANAPLVLVVHPSLPVNSPAALIALAKKNPGKLNYASAGNGSGAHLASELFKSMAHIDLVHVPYKSGGQSVSALLSGQVELSFPTIPPALPHIKAGRLRALAVTSPHRSVTVPELPTISESALPGYDGNTWNGIVAPAGTPPPVLNLLAEAIASVVKTPDVAQRLLDSGLEPASSSPEEFSRHIAAEVKKWANVIAASGAKID